MATYHSREVLRRDVEAEACRAEVLPARISANVDSSSLTTMPVVPNRSNPMIPAHRAMRISPTTALRHE
jgi:hypothetical protein